jgi:hypothetical protein
VHKKERKQAVSRQRLLAAFAGAIALGMSSGLMAQAYPPENYSPLLFDPGDTKYVFRLSGAPWICRGDTFCKPIKIDGVADKDAALATIEPLGFAGPRYFLAYKQANVEKGKEVTLSCTEERCSRLDATAGDAAWLGNFQVKQGDRTVTRSAILRRVEAKAGRAQILWCTENDCSELPLTRDTEMYLTFMGNNRADGRNAAFLRDKSGAVLSCAQAEEGVSDQIACEKTKLVLSDFPKAPTVAAAPPPPAPPAPATAPAPSATDAERTALAASIDRAITAGDFVTADRLMADATRRFAGYSAWPPLQQKLAKARADVRQAEARRLITEARRFAQAGDFSHAEAMLQEADKQAPGFAETAQARAEIANLRTARGQRYRDRQQFEAAIDQALATNRLFEAERLLADYAQRYGQDPDYRLRANRLAELRNGAPNQARITEARAHIASARQAMARNDFGEADRHLDLADRAAPGFPEIAQARADLARRIAEIRRNPPTQTGNLPPPPGPRNQ